MHTHPLLRISVAALGALLAGAANAQGAAPYKIAFIDPLSGPFAAVGETMLLHTRFAVEDLNAKNALSGGRKFELIQLDSKLSAQESQSALQSAIDQGARAVVTGGSGSSVVAAIVQSASRWNQRNPGKEVIVFNHSSIDPELTGKHCNFWHFQTEANTAMKMKALANFARKQPDIHKVYLFNQDYAHGKQWATYGRQLVGLARPDVQFVGEQLHGVGRVKDFAPYVAQMKQAGADTLISGNWGPDMMLLLKAAGEAGMNPRILNHSAGSMPGTVLAASQAKTDRLTWVAEWHPGQEGTPKVDALAKAFRAKTGKEFLSPRIDLTPRLLAAAIQKAGSDEPVKVARALEDLTLDSSVGPVRMRAQDHQLLLPQVVNTIAPVDGKSVKVGWDGVNWGFRTEAMYSGNELAQGSDCKMVRP
ncbi:MAG: branched-chain amino acid ABC transporter substrate-binding protein [Ottowia sp.]|nr:branched-chain amino acid ABC transporter substrate-binding protein [Ottowia sp.]HRL36666.1 branched-chain amino acid ABC transporter substrate-binding protein [Ottowia beijingensis]